MITYIAYRSAFMSAQVRNNPARLLNWDVQEGEAREIASQLRDRDARALVFVSSEKNDERTKARFETLKRASELIDLFLEVKLEGRWKALIEALTPDVPLSPNRLIEAGMLAQAIQKIVESNDFAKASDLAKAGHFSKSNPSSQPNRWKKAGLIFAVPYKGNDLYPVYALEFKKGVRPLPVMERLLKALEDKDDWQKAFWFGSVNSYLHNKMPKDLLKSKPEEVLRAAEAEVIGVQHG
jgi:hypothetical protein